MRRISTRARWTAGLTAAAAALAGLGTLGAQAATPVAAAARTATTSAGASAVAADDATAVAAAPQRRLPTAARRGAAARDAARGTKAVTVRFRTSVRAAAVAAAPGAGAGSFAAAGASVAPASNAVTYTVKSTDADAFLRSMKARSDVLDADVDVRAYFDATPNDPQYLTAASVDAAKQVDYMPAIGAPTAWDYGRGDAGIKVAVIDSGVDVGHPDLASKIVARHNVVTGTTTVTDAVGHGTFVAGVVAAATNNNVGVAGAGWDTSIIAVKVARSDGSLFLSDVATGIRWATDNDADVINLSLGADVGSTALANAVKYAQTNGVLVVAAAGNSGQEGNLRSYPAAYPGVVSVGATDAKGHRAWFSEYGSWVTMAAPGVSIRSTIPRTFSDFWPSETNYANGDGTSFASPLVAGAAALVWARSPNATAAQVKAAVVNTAHGYAGFGLGKGQLDMGRAMKAIVPTTNPTISTPAAAATITDTVGLTADAGMFGSNIGTKIGWYVDGTRVGFSASGAPFSWDPRGWAEGAHTIQARTCTSAGACPTTGASVSVTLDLPAPTITSPADTATVPGYADVTVTSPAGGGVAIYAGSTRLGFATSGTTVEANFTGLVNGTHALQAVICNATGTRCEGDRSPVVNVTSSAAGLQRIGVTNAAFSPNGDGVKDTVTVTYFLTDNQTVHTDVLNAAGTVVWSADEAGGLPTGNHSLVWSGVDNASLPVPAGAYTIRISTTDTGSRIARIAASVRVDRASPVVNRPAGTPTTFYPVVDGYQDTFRPKFTVGETSTVSLVLRNSRGSTVRTLSQTVQAGKAGTLTWNGKNTAGSLVPAGTYTWRVVAVDAAGRKTTTTARSIAVRRTKLTSRTVTLTKTGDRAHARNPQGCATAVFAGSTYATGFWLKNNCAKGDVDIAAGYYYFTVPAAVRYTGFTLRTTGRSHSAPVDVFGGLYTSQADNYDITYPARTVPSGATTTRTLTLGTIRSGGRPNANRVIDVLVFVSNARRAPFTDWDIKSVSVTVSYQVLA